MDLKIREFCAQQREWLESELSQGDGDDVIVSNEKNGEKNQNILSGLQVSEISVGLYGRTIVTLTSGREEEGSKYLSSHRFTTGDEVEIRSKVSSSKQNHQGVISQVTETLIAVALFGKQRKNKNGDDDDDDEDNEDDILSGSQGLLTIVPSRSIEVHKKYLAALQELEKQGSQHPVAGNVIRALFDPDSYYTATKSTTTTAISHNNNNNNTNNHPHLDHSQLEAIQFALSEERPIVCIHGPPGTGKTTTLVEIIRRAVMEGKKVLVTAPSNVAVDNLLARLVTTTTKKKPSNKKNLRLIRLGHPARLQPEILPFSLEAQIQNNDQTEIVQQVRNELKSFLKIVSNPGHFHDKRLAYREMKLLRTELRQREEKMVRELLTNAQVVLATCVGAANRILDKLLSDNNPTSSLGFDLVIIDEAAQALEAACWIPTLRGKRLILAGDHKQLPPTIQSTQPQVVKGLAQTMFERIMALYGDIDTTTTGKVSRMLQVQYRMHQNISDWASQALYAGLLKTHDTVAKRTLQQLVSEQSKNKKPIIQNDQNNDNTPHDEDCLGPMLFIDTAGCDMREEVTAAGSRYNPREAELVGQHVRRLITFGLEPEQIAVITPYNGQVEQLKTLLRNDFPQLEIRTVDGFQGGEREAVVLSLVRSTHRSKSSGIGFLRDDRRLNVAVTRAKRHVCLVADSETVSQSTFIRNLLEWMEQHGETRSAAEESYLEDNHHHHHHTNVPLPSTQPSKPPKQTAPDEDLIRRVREFVQTGHPGQSLILDAQLSRFDRLTIHEEAERLGIEHVSQGVEGINRRLVLTIPKTAAAPKSNVGIVEPVVEAATPAPQPRIEAPPPPPLVTTPVANSLAEGTPEAAAEPLVGTAPPGEPEIPNESTAIQPFAALVGDTEEDGGESSHGNVNHVEELGVETSNLQVSPVHGMLGDLARERAIRENQRANQQQPQRPVGVSSKPKNKGQKLGGKGKQTIPEKLVVEEKPLDDMAFLDAEIVKVQNSHGRTIDGKGSYRTIVNGILLTKPQPPDANKKDSTASLALQAKLKKAQDGRKQQVKKKK